MIALVSLYIIIVLRIYYLERVNVTFQRENGIGGASVPLKPGSSSQVPRTSLGCASALLHYYVAASLIWNVLIFWRRRRRRVAMLIGITSLAAIISLRFSGEYCKTSSGEWANSNAFIARSEGSASWSDYSPKQTMDDNIRISFRLHDPDDVAYPDKFAGVVGYKCADKADLPPSLSKRTILNFTTTIATDLKLLFLGDSIAEQFAQAFDAAVLGNGFERNRLAQTYTNGPNNINVHNCLTIAAPIRGGGVSAFWRVVTLMSMSTRTPFYVCEHRWKTWNEKQAHVFVNHRYVDHVKEVRPANELNTTTLGESNLQGDYSVGAFDAIVLRVPHGWLKIKQITKERIVEAINLANELVGAQTVIISTLPLNNNVLTPSDWDGISKINHMIRDIARSWEATQPGKVRWLLVQEFGNFTNQILRMNAEQLLMTNSSTPDFSQEGWELKDADFLLKRLSSETFWFPSICMVCAERTYAHINEKKNEVQDCIRSKISRDGAHWCTETLGPRYSASVACLLGCVYNGNEPSINAQDVEMVRQCEKKCNDQFMSILPVDKEW
eukprot:CAMPEP_0172331712 /NCGR_PEP_ID=MMETSP1058-20130122/62066_1 /TAXON_ID=83371 /ORGANISM="Detonula confervacea, Strain CCMP 353" /LENGTH=554 /DNA_ID=CAMNT_0013048981 /DNA_START=388 /DNA_END=2049 /DNA_ORIENTATION=-